MTPINDKCHERIMFFNENAKCSQILKRKLVRPIHYLLFVHVYNKQQHQQQQQQQQLFAHRVVRASNIIISFFVISS